MARDTVQRQEPVGTGVIRGRVVTVDSGNPVRRANVSLQAIQPPVTLQPPGTTSTTAVRGTTTVVTSPNGTPIQVSSGARRTAMTDSQGMFEFAGLPPGSYRLIATAGQYSGGYLSMIYGGKRPNGPGSTDLGTPIELADGQRFDKATIALPRGAVITGRVSDENGEPMARVQVFTMFYAPGSTRGQRIGSGDQTDDLGQFRLYGLTSGEYIVVAEARGPTFMPPNAPPETEDEKIGYMTTYFPGTPDEGSAQRVRARAGAETTGLEIRMATGRLFRISGIVTDSQGRSAARGNGQLFKSGSTGGSSNYGFSTDEQGRFQMRNIPPGNYRLIVRGRPAGNNDGQQGEPAEMANMPVAISSDLEGLVVITAPGATISGQVVFEPGPPQLPAGQQSFQMRVNAVAGDIEGNMGVPSPQGAIVTPDLTFTMRGMFGDLLLRSGGPNMYLKSVIVGGQDITDTPHTFKNGEQVIVVMTTRASTVEGVVSDAVGKPVTDAAIMVFSEDKAAWRPNSVRTRRATVDPAGRYRLLGLLPGRYYAVAVSRDRLSGRTSNEDVSFFEQLAKEATTFVVGEDEQRQVDLKIAAGAGG